MLILGQAGALSADRFTALFGNQRQTTGNDLRDIDLPARKGTLNGTPLFHPSDPVRVIRDTSITATANPAFLEFTNGDILPGQVTEFTPAGNDDGLPAFFDVDLAHDPQTVPSHASRVRVRESSVKRVVGQSRNGTHFEPGLIALKDGRRVRSESIRWTSDGLQALTPQGVLAWEFSQLADVHVAGRDSVDGAVSDASWSFVYPDDFLMRIQTTNGAQLTFPRAMVTREVDQIKRRRHRNELKQVEQIAVQPAWALDAILVPRECIVVRSYRRGDEVPLSLLPVAAQRHAAGFHHWPWQRNRGVQGSTLRSGEIAVDLGLGTHSYSELTFQLPPYAVQFRSLVGLDYAVGRGGCVQCRLHSDGPSGSILWDSGFLRGDDGIRSVGPLSLDGIEQLTLVTDFAHDKRPTGADPFDIRDQVAWLLPTVEVDATKLSPPRDLAQLLPRIEGWSLSDEVLKELKLTPLWDRKAGRWEIAMALTRDNKSLLRMSRRLTVTAKNARLPIEVRQGGGRRDRGHIVRVEVDGTPVSSTKNGDIKTEHADRKPQSRVWMLSNFMGQEIRVDVLVESRGNWSTGVIWDAVSPMPSLVE